MKIREELVKQRKKIAIILVLIGALATTALHILGEGDAFQTAEVLFTIILFW